MSNEIVIKTTGLTKRYGRKIVVNNVNINLERGAIYGLIGKNGAGKTTILKMIADLAHPTRGEVEILGRTGRDKDAVLDRLGVLIEAPGIFKEMTAFDNLRLKAVALGVYNEQNIKEILQLIGLENTGKKKAGKFSLGMKQRLGIGLSLVGEPDILVLDEPINGLDPQGIAEVRETILKLNRERHMTVIISSHILEELSKLVTHFGIIDNGVILEELSSEELSDKCNERIDIIVDDMNAAVTILESMDIHNYQIMNDTNIRVSERLHDSAQINRNLTKAGIIVSQISICNESVEEYFLNVTNGGIKKC